MGVPPSVHYLVTREAIAWRWAITAGLISFWCWALFGVMRLAPDSSVAQVMWRPLVAGGGCFAVVGAVACAVAIKVARK